MIAFESLIERDYLFVLDYEPCVVSFEEQPLTIEYRWGGKTLHYTPDFHVVLVKQRNALVECKPAALVDSDENRRKWQAALAQCGEWDWDFVIATDTDLRTGYRLQNIQAVTYYARLTVPPEIKGRTFAILCDTSTSLTVGDLAQALSPSDPKAALPFIMHMVYHHEVAIPLDAAPISMRSPVSLPGREPSYTQEVDKWVLKGSQ